MAHVQRTGPSRNFPKGGWEARWRDSGKPGDGRPKHKAKTFATKREAERYLAQVAVDKEQGTYVDPARSRTRFSEVAEDWRSTASRSLRPKTLNNYEGALKTHVLPYFDSTPVGAIDFDAVNRWVSALSKDHSPSVVRGAYKVLRLVLAHAVRSKKIAYNPATDIDLPQESKKEMHFLSAQQVEALADAFPRPEQALLIRFAAYTGLRAGEIAALRVKNLDLTSDEPHVRVEENVADVNGKLHFGEPKTKASRRTVPLPGFLADQLKVYLGDRRVGDRDGHVFLSEQGYVWRHSNFMKRFWRRAVERAGLPTTLRFHDLRHTFASLMISFGAHPKELQELMGHASANITLDRYSHVFPKRKSELARLSDAAYRRSLAEPESTGKVVGLR